MRQFILGRNRPLPTHNTYMCVDLSADALLASSVRLATVSDATLQVGTAPAEMESTGLDAVLAELEAQCRRAVKSYCIMLLTVVLCLPIILAPILLIAWSASA